jgi:predicted ribosomally synthesized peptide with nif11-like leader
MSLDQVQAFYVKVASDESFRARLQSVNNKAECSEFVKSEGFDFTPEEFEQYTAQLLEQDRPDKEITNLREEDLVAVAAGFVRPGGIIRPMYGLPSFPGNKFPRSPFPPIVRPIYGLPRLPGFLTH